MYNFCDIHHISIMTKSIVLIEDDKDLREYLLDLLIDSGFTVKAFSEGIAALKYIKKMSPDLVVLDLGLPTMGGETVCTEIKKVYPDLPVIILTAKGTTTDIVKGLNLGADDYVSKPFESDVLLVRIKARLRENVNNNSVLKIADLELNTKTFEVKRNKKLIKLTPQEFKLLEYMMNNRGRVLTRDIILNRIWLYSTEIETRVVDVYVGYLRKKIDNGHKKKLIHSVRGFGYIFKE